MHMCASQMDASSSAGALWLELGPVCGDAARFDMVEALERMSGADQGTGSGVSPRVQAAEVEEG